MRSAALVAARGGVLLPGLFEPGELECAVVAGVAADRAVGNAPGGFGAAIEELAIVRDDQHRGLLPAQPVFQPYHRVEVEVIGRLIQQQQVGGP